MTGKTTKLEYSLALLMLLSAGVIFLKFSFTNAINLVFILIYLFFFFEYYFVKKSYRFFNYKPPHPNRSIILPILFICIVHFFLLFFIRGSDDHLTFDPVWYVVLITCLYLDIDVLTNSVRAFGNMIFWISVLAIGNYFLSIAGIQLPYIEFSAVTRETTYYIYPGTVRLYGQDYTIFGRTGFRLSGIFPEPSMFGILCGLVLYSEVFIGQRFRKNVIVLALLLSLSTGAIVMSVGYLIFGIKRIGSKIAALIALSIVVVAIWIYIPTEIIERFFLDKISGDVINNRITGGFDSFYHNFLVYDDSFFLLFGRGADVLSNNNFIASDYRGLILKFGFLGIVILFVLMFSFILYKESGINKWKVLFVFGVIFAHRSWLTILFVFLFFMYYLSIKDRKKSIS